MADKDTVLDHLHWDANNKAIVADVPLYSIAPPFAFRYTKTSTPSVTGGTGNFINWENEIFDDQNIWAGTSNFKIPISGIWYLSAQTEANSAAEFVAMSIWINGTEVVQGNYGDINALGSVTGKMSGQVHGVFELKAGDVVQFFMIPDDTSNMSGRSVMNWCYGFMISGMPITN